MKNYYQNLSKEDKLKIKNQFYQEFKNSEVITRLKRVNIYSIFSLLFAIIIIVLSYMYEDKHVSSFIIAGILIFIALIFTYARWRIKLNLLNKIALQNKPKKGAVQ